MRFPASVRAAAVVLSTAFFSSGAVLAQATAPEPRTMVDTAPLPATERGSVGAVILMDEPVLAQREAMQRMAARAPDTTAMGAGPARVLQRQQTAEELDFQRALERAFQQRRTPK